MVRTVADVWCAVGFVVSVYEFLGVSQEMSSAIFFDVLVVATTF